MRIDPEESSQDTSTDGRRARLADVQRVESALIEATARLKAMEEFIANRDSAPISRSQFYAQIYAMAILAGKRPNFIRDVADIAWESYNEALNRVPRKTIDDMYGSNAGMPAIVPDAGSNEPAGC